MSSSEQKILAVIGAGPKGLAVAVKAKVLKEFGLPVDQVILIEKNGVAANWSGDFGYTNGEMKLGTSPEKDVVFPIEIDVGDANLNRRIEQRLLQFTWSSFLVQTKRFSDWVDRGRPAPCHQVWATYLRWVSEQLTPEAPLVKAEVIDIDLSEDGKRWQLSLRGPHEKLLLADRLMLTGPGKTRMEFVDHQEGKLPLGIYDLESFWAALKEKKFLANGRIAIVGAGENAASALLALSQYAPDLRVHLISPKGFISTRAEGFYENQFYSQPERTRWRQMQVADRENFIERTDLGVFSAHAMGILNDQIRHQIVAGRVIGIRAEESGLILSMTYGGQVEDRSYDQVILATGFDQVSALKSILAPRALATIEEALGSKLQQSQVVQSIEDDLSIRGVRPALHLPMLAGLMQGPGFANLSCLGRLSDRILIPGRPL